MEAHLQSLRGVFSTHCLPLCIPMLEGRDGVPSVVIPEGVCKMACPEGLKAGWGWAIVGCKRVAVAELGLAL